MVKISIIIPNYNGATYIGKCLNSIISQTLNDIEIIVIDDGSTDDSINVIKEFIRLDKRIILIEQPNMNASVARNNGLSIANGEYIFFIDSDDFLYDNTVLEKMYNDIQPCDILIGNYIEIDKNEKVVSNYRLDLDKHCNENPIIEYFNVSPPPSNKLYRNDIIKKNKVYFSNVRIGQDLNFYIKYLINCNKIKEVDYPIYNYRVLDNSMTRIKNLNFVDITNCFLEIEKYFNLYNVEKLYYCYLNKLRIKHSCYQLSRLKFISNKEERFAAYYYIISSLGNNIIKNSYKDDETKKYIIKLRFLRIFHTILLSNFFIRIFSFFKKG